MKYKKILFSIFLLVFLFSVVGFVRVLAEEPTFKLINATIEEKSSDVDAVINSYDNNDLETDITFHKIDDYVKFKLTIKNNDSKEYKVKLITDNNANNNANNNVLYAYDSHADETIGAGASFDVVLTATYKNEVTDMNERDQANSFNLSFTFVDENGNVVTDDVTINPRTGDNIMTYIITGIISLIGLILLFIFKSKNNKKEKYLFLLALFIPTIVKGIESSIVVNISNELKLYDKVVVTYSLNGEEKEKVVKYDTQLSKPDDPVKEGYNFVGWYINDEEYNFDSPVKKDTKIEAKYELIQYTINYDLDGGNDPNNATEYNVETDTFNLVNPVKEGYIFDGWTESNGDTPQKIVTITKGSYGNKTFVAHFSPDPNTPYTVYHKYEKLGGGFDVEEEHLTGETGSKVTPEFREKNGFDNPSSQEIIIEPTGDSEVTYEYTRTLYQLTLNNIDDIDTTFETRKYPYETEIVLTAKDKTGYTFAGWNNGHQAKAYTFNITSDITLSPEYTINNYEVTVNTNGGTGVDNFTRDYNTELGTLPTTTKTGYTFGGWYSDSEFENPVNASTKVVDNMTIYAKWTINTYNVTFNTNGGTSVDNFTREYNTELGTLPTTTKTGYTFGGWYSDSEFENPVNASTKVVDNMTIYAKWTINTYEISFNGNGNTSGETASVTCEYGKTCTLTTNGFVKEGYTFAGWTEELNGEIVHSNGAQVTYELENVTKVLYAKWTINKYTVTFNSNGGTNVASVEKKYGEEIGTLPTTTKEERIFEGWYTGLTDGDKIDEHTVVYDDVEYFAHWSSYICRKATTLHTATCDSSGGCANAGYTESGSMHTTTITFGTISNGNIKTGDAYDCDVNGDGTYDPDTERFYYVKTTDDKAIFIYSDNFEGSEGAKHENIFEYDIALTKLPTKEQWSNVLVTFDDNRAGRFLTRAEVTSVCGSPATGVGGLDSCTFFFENTKYVNTNVGRSAIWLQKEGDSYYRIFTPERKIGSITNTSKDAARPAIEVPLANISDKVVLSFNANGGEVITNAKLVNKGSTIGTLPTPTRSDYAFDGWYDALTGGNLVDGNTTINSDTEIFARWKKDITNAVINNQNITMRVSQTVQIDITPDSELENYTFTSNDTDIVIVDENGNVTALAAGTTTITITGALSHKTATVNVTAQQEIVKFEITFDSNGGNQIESVEVPANTAIGELPVPVQSGYDFKGWYKESTLENLVTASTIVTEPMTLYAKWYDVNCVAEIGNECFTSVPLAVNSITTNTQTEIKLLKDNQIPQSGTVNLNRANIVAGRNIILNLNGYTLTNSKTVAPNIDNYGTLKIINGTIKNSSTQGAINNRSTGNMILEDVTVIATGTKQALYNEGGVVVIKGTSTFTASSSERPAVHNANGGTMTIESGTTIISTNYSAVENLGTLTIGTVGGEVLSSPVLEGKVYGIRLTASPNSSGSSISINFYDGIIKGETAVIEDENAITTIETGTEKVYGTEGDFHTLHLSIPTGYLITLDPNGGEVTPTSLTIDIGDELGELPTPNRQNYDFNGWFTELENGTQVNEHTVPSSSTTYHALWTYQSSDEIVNFNMINDVMSTYYSKINTWKSDEDTFSTNMINNFNTYNCKCNDGTCNTSGTELCDKSLGYNTGVNGIVNVYLSDENTKAKGDLVTYTTSDSGTIYNMIPGTTYYWESQTDSDIHGYVKALGNRRILNVDGVRNIRDLGGLEVDTNNDGVMDGKTKYGILFRGEKLWENSGNVDRLEKLGINEEVDLRASSERTTNEVSLSNFKQREIKHYQIDYNDYLNNYNLARNTVIEIMNDVINNKKIYFHCRIGTDRTGTIAYILEGLLGVNQEEMLEDYELSFFFGLVNRTRFYATDPSSSVSKTEKFVYMYDRMKNSQEVYDWFMLGSTNVDEDNELINNFRLKMIDTN